MKKLALIVAAVLALACAAPALADSCECVHRDIHTLYEWTPNDDHTHTVVCAEEGCRYTATAPCTDVVLELPEGDVTVCPICGRVEGGERLARKTNARVRVSRAYGWTGRPTVYYGRVGEHTVLTFTYEKSGRGFPVNNKVNLTVPVRRLNAFRPEFIAGAADRDLKAGLAPEGLEVTFRMTRSPAMVLVFSDAE